MTLRGSFKHVLAAMCIGMSSFAAQAATVQLVGDTMVYVYDDQQANIDLWGTIDIVGDTVRFNPTTFRAESSNGDGSAVTTATFLFDSVYSKNGSAIDEVAVHEFGDYSIINGGDVQVDLWVDSSTNPGGGDFTFASTMDSFSANSGTGGWGLNGTLTDADFGVQSDMAVKIQNTLTAITYESGETAWVQKKINFVAAAAVVPVPAAAWLFGSAMLGLVAVGRRKVRAA